MDSRGRFILPWRPVPTLYQWRHKGIGPKSRRVGRHLRYKPEDVLAWLEEQE